jgi:2-keto-4-pentenoate hydratase/2-oxohepta-3-ene-1,7-dioic acid hydratase in catechol pathway
VLRASIRRRSVPGHRLQLPGPSGRDPHATATRQAWFNKQQTCIIATGDPIWIPAIAPGQIDYEGELGMVIGRRCKNVPNDNSAVLDVVAGFTIVNDVSVRDWQDLEPGMVVSKSFDTHGPTGPWIVTTDEIGDPLDLHLRTYVSDDLRPDGHPGDMLFDIYEQVSYLSSAFTLEVGDVISTGTPSGIAWHRARHVPEAWRHRPSRDRQDRNPRKPRHRRAALTRWRRCRPRPAGSSHYVQTGWKNRRWLPRRPMSQSRLKASGVRRAYGFPVTR